jgi:hypothetical protein
LTYGSLGGKIFSFCPVHWLSVCPITRTILKSNTIQVTLSCTIHYFSADQTHPKSHYNSFDLMIRFVNIMMKINVYTMQDLFQPIRTYYRITLSSLYILLEDCELAALSCNLSGYVAFMLFGLREL